MVYATVVAENVEALSGFEAISAVLHNSRKVIKDLQKFMLYGQPSVRSIKFTGELCGEVYLYATWVEGAHVEVLMSWWHMWAN